MSAELVPAHTGGAAPAVAETPLEAENRLIEEQHFVTGRISDSVRNISFGLLATFYGIVSSDAAFATRVASQAPTSLRLIAAAAFAALAFDYFQYLAGSLATDRAMARKEGPNAYQFEESWWQYRARLYCYWAKQAFALAGCLALAYALFSSWGGAVPLSQPGPT